jgi:hypothetical protein
MPKALCISGMVIAALIFIIFLTDLVLPASWAPFMKASRLMDIVFILCAIGLGYLSWATWKDLD